MRTVYVVTAGTGEYSDRTEWPIRVVQTEDRAKEMVTLLDAEAAPLWAQVQAAAARDNTHNKGRYGTTKKYTEYDVREKLFNCEWSKIEPSLREPDYTGFYFSYEPVKIED